jgi:general secretion pathway protein I
MSRPRERGFTLIEVIVALAILSIAVVAVIQGFAQGLRLLKLAGDHQYATLIADQKAREIVTPKAGEAQGEEHGFEWQTVTTELPAPDLVRDGVREPAWRVYQIAVKVRWSGREVELTTLRTAPVEDTDADREGGPPRSRSSTPGTGAPVGRRTPPRR